MTYADDYKRRAELLKHMGKQSIVDALYADIARRRIEASAQHMARRIRAQRRTALVGL